MVTTTTGPRGTFTASFFTQNRNDAGNWQISTAYAGAPGYLPSAGGPCTVVVQDNF